jgi:MFS family permease
LRSRNFRLFFGGQGISLIGTWMTRVATSWLVYRLTGSVLLLGVVGFASQIPAFFLAPVAGVLADRWNRQRLLVVTQALAMLQSLALAALALTGVITVTHIILLSILQGLINAFDMPIRQSFLVHMVDRKEDLANAIALNSSLFNGARLVGPSLAGVIIAAAGEGVCFLIDGISYIAVIAALLAMHVPPQNNVPSGRPVLHELVEGLRYVVSFTVIAYILLLLALVSLVGMPYTVLMPVISSELLGGGANTFGFLMAASGLGALAGALYLAARRSVLGLGRLIPLAAAAFGLALVAVALSRFVWLSLALMIVAGFTMMTQMAACNTLLQTIVEDDKRGRVMSFYTMAFMGATPLGSLLAGAVAQRIGTPKTLMAGGICCIIGALWFARKLPAIREKVRPIYVQLGILPEIASGLQAAATAPTIVPQPRR